jgi:hypothetical protein
MALLRTQLFGAVRVSHADQPRDARLIHTVQGRLAWLVLNRRKTHFGQVDALNTSLDARWGTAWHLVKVLTTA